MPIVRIGLNSADDFTGMEDTWLAQDDPDANKVNTGDISIGKYASGGHAHGLLRFLGLSNITGPVTVTEVRMVGFVEFLNVTAGHTLSARRLLRNAVWDQASWNSYSTGNAWTTGGALSNGNDRSSDIRGDYVFDATEVFQDPLVMTGEGMRQDVEDWINGDLPNYGWHIERTDGADDEEYFAYTSSDGGNPDGFLPYLYVDYEEAGAGGDMACVIALGLAVSGNLDGRGAMTGTRPMALTVAGNLDGRGRIASTMPIAFSVSASIDGRGRITTTMPAAFSVSGNLDGRAPIAGTMPIAFSVVGNLDGRGPMTFSTSAAFTVAGVLQGAAEGVMSFSTAAVFALAGNLDGRTAMAGTMPLGLAVSGNLDGRGPIATPFSFAFSFAGDLEGIAPGYMSLDADLAFAIVGDLAGRARLGTIAPLAFTWSGALRGAGDLFGATLPASFAVSGELTDLPDLAELIGDMRFAFGWLADLVNSGQGTPITVTVAQFRAKWRAVDVATVQYLDRYYNFAKRDEDVVWVRSTFEDGTRLDLPIAQYKRLTTTEKENLNSSGVSVVIIDGRDGAY